MSAYVDYSDQTLTPEALKAILAEAVEPKKHVLKDLVLLEKNANVMTQAKFDRLVENIKRDGRLTQWSFVMKLPNGKYGVPSGNHRVKAAIEAGLTEEWCITCEVTLPKDEATRIQISHNAIHGDQQNLVLLELADTFSSTELLRLSGVDFDLAKLNQDKLDFAAIDSGSLEFRQVLFFFTDFEVAKLDRLLESIDNHLTGDSPLYLMEKKRYNEFVDNIVRLKKIGNIKSTATAINVMLDFIAKNIDSILEENKKEQKEKPNGQ